MSVSAFVRRRSRRMKNGSIYRFAYAGVAYRDEHSSVALRVHSARPYAPGQYQLCTDYPLRYLDASAYRRCIRGIADLLGTAISGYAPNPLITLSAVA